MKVEINIPDDNFVHSIKQLSAVLGFKEFKMNVESDIVTILCSEDSNSNSDNHICKCGSHCKCNHHHEETVSTPEIETESDVQDDDIPEVEENLTAHSDVESSVSADAKKTMEKTCPVCKNVFEPSRPNQNYCCARCKRLASYERELKAKNVHRSEERVRPVSVGVKNGKAVFACLECGKEFTRSSGRQVYCSEYCRRQGKMKRLGLKKQKSIETKICPVCNKEFETSRANKKYCSSECKIKFGIQQLTSIRANKQASKLPSEPSVVKPPVVPITPPVTEDSVKSKVENRPIFSFKCKLCDNLFGTIHKEQKFCSPCLDAFGEEQCEQLVIEEEQKKRAIAEAAKIRFKVCPKCGHTFEAKNPAKEFFCPRCTQRAMNAPMLQK